MTKYMATGLLFSVSITFGCGNNCIIWNKIKDTCFEKSCKKSVEPANDRSLLAAECSNNPERASVDASSSNSGTPGHPKTRITPSFLMRGSFYGAHLL